MADRFDVIEAGGRRRRRWIGVAVVAALLVVPAVSLLLSRDPGPPPPVPASTSRPVATPVAADDTPNAVHPRAVRKGGDEVIEVVFPDGRRAEVRYPAELALAGLGVRPFQGVWVDGQYRPLTAPYSVAAEVGRGGRPLRTLTPNVALWPPPPSGVSRGDVLLFTFGPWRVALPDQPVALTFEQRLAAAEGLRGTVTEDGYLVLSARGAVRLARPGETLAGLSVGPQLWFGGGAGPLLVFTQAPHCRAGQAAPSAVLSRTQPSGAVCRDGVQIAVSSSEEFRGKALDGIRITLK
ncbi:hypothetical protein [Nonomuraea pusilla]|uniref:Uncharacterized protein n=1 Tax=Nonomuraea pusilla TaxID=46177 RepID=A0A1H8BT60_9ACTN|nr:hypothetical protein [Nonomuraea pusilla]SEM85983.1 hypothetical protein SAMN05660976_06191 [Nonomuraea pusilla]